MQACGTSANTSGISCNMLRLDFAMRKGCGNMQKQEAKHAPAGGSARELHIYRPFETPIGARSCIFPDEKNSIQRRLNLLPLADSRTASTNDAIPDRERLFRFPEAMLFQDFTRSQDLLIGNFISSWISSRPLDGADLPLVPMR